MSLTHMADETLPDRVVPPDPLRDLELGPDAVHRRHEDGLAVARRVEREQAAEGPDIGQHGRG